jgi:hypothetical protein
MHILCDAGPLSVYRGQDAICLILDFSESISRGFSLARSCNFISCTPTGSINYSSASALFGFFSPFSLSLLNFSKFGAHSPVAWTEQSIGSLSSVL